MLDEWVLIVGQVVPVFGFNTGDIVGENNFHDREEADLRSAPGVSSVFSNYRDLCR